MRASELKSEDWDKIESIVKPYMESTPLFFKSIKESYMDSYYPHTKSKIADAFEIPFKDIPRYLKPISNQMLFRDSMFQAILIYRLGGGWILGMK